MRLSFPEAERRKLVDLTEQTLWSPEGTEQLTYLREQRGISDTEIRAMRFGYMPARYEGHELSGRLVMPLYDPYGLLVAITSRDNRPDAERKHWHESFEKNEHIYGLNLAKETIIARKKAIVVEGQFDVAYLRSLGFTNTVGILGSALSLLQTALLGRYCSEIYLFFDGDKGGREATARSLKMYRDRCLATFGLHLIPVATPDDKDPDDFTREEVVSLCKGAKEQYIGTNGRKQQLVITC